MRRWCDALIRFGAPLVPSDLRREWLREWRAEIAFADARAQRCGRRLPASAAWRAAGAIPHAIWLRWDQWRVDMIWQDLRHALRALRAKPAFTLVTLLTLAIGIGGTAAIFGAVNAVVLRPLPYPDSGRLVQVFKTVGDAAGSDWRHRLAARLRGLASRVDGFHRTGGAGRGRVSAHRQRRRRAGEGSQRHRRLLRGSGHPGDARPRHDPG